MKKILMSVMTIFALLGPAAGFAGNKMPITKIWGGPFESTQIAKLVDYSNGVVCYVYSPVSVTTEGGPPYSVKRFIGNSVGSISCVKVGKTRAKKRK